MPLDTANKRRQALSPLLTHSLPRVPSTAPVLAEDRRQSAGIYRLTATGTTIVTRVRAARDQTVRTEHDQTARETD